MKKMMMIAAATLSVGAALVAMPGTASTPEEWAALNQRVGRACIAMSGLARPQLLAQRISFSDDIGIEVRMLRGRDAQGRSKRLLCSYNRSTGRTEVQEAGSWSGPTITP